MDVSSLVRREVHARFTAPDAVQVERLLETTSLPFLHERSRHRERDRVHLAILKQANGNIESFARSLALAATDWRDLLVAEGLAGDDWPEVLRRAGFEVPGAAV